MLCRPKKDWSLKQAKKRWVGKCILGGTLTWHWVWGQKCIVSHTPPPGGGLKHSLTVLKYVALCVSFRSWLHRESSPEKKVPQPSAFFQWSLATGHINKPHEKEKETRLTEQ